MKKFSVLLALALTISLISTQASAERFGRRGAGIVIGGGWSGPSYGGCGSFGGWQEVPSHSFGGWHEVPSQPIHSGWVEVPSQPVHSGWVEVPHYSQPAPVGSFQPYLGGSCGASVFPSSQTHSFNGWVEGCGCGNCSSHRDAFYHNQGSCVIGGTVTSPTQPVAPVQPTEPAPPVTEPLEPEPAPPEVIAPPVEDPEPAPPAIETETLSNRITP